MLHLPDGDIPCNYDIRWRNNPPSLSFFVHQDWIKQIPKIPGNTTQVAGTRNRLTETPLGNWRGVFDEKGTQPLGFDGVLTNKGWDSHGDGDSGFLHYSCNLNGDLSNLRLAASISALTAIESLPNIATYSHLLQLITIRTIVGEGPGSWKLFGAISDKLALFLTNLQKSSSNTHSQLITATEKAMTTAFSAVQGKSNGHLPGKFSAITNERGNLTLIVPGNTCSVHPAEFVSEPMRGYDFTSHNIDSPAQFFALLAGLVAVNQFARATLSC